MAVPYDHLPQTPGVYLMRDERGRILYVGKAANLRRRVSSYFQRPRLHQGSGGQAHDARLERLVREVARVGYRKTETALEALILEAELIKRHQPPYNILEKDDTSFLFVEVTREEFPRVLLVRGRQPAAGRRFGPFTSAAALREALHLLRKIFPWSVHPSTGRRTSEHGKPGRACLDYELGLCPGTCVGAIDRDAYSRNIRHLVQLLEGKRSTVVRELEREMRLSSDREEYERAAELRRQLFGLRHIQDVALIGESEIVGKARRGRGLRIEGYDVSNISGTAAVGAMVVFTGGKPDRDEYRKFRIQTFSEPNPARSAGGDTGMLKEVLSRRFSRARRADGWQLPDCILIDGGRGQVNVARRVLEEHGLKIPVVGIAKGPARKKNEFVGKIPGGVDEQTLIRVRNEAHRFAISYHRRVRQSMSLKRGVR